MLTFILAIMIAPQAQAQTSKSKSKTSTNIYEQEAGEEKTKSFTAKVRVVRDVSDEVEVFFEGDKNSGAYTLPRGAANYASMLKTLEASKKAQGPAVSVTADEDKRIKSVEGKAAESNYQFPTDPNKTWDYEKALQSIEKK